MKPVERCRPPRVAMPSLVLVAVLTGTVAAEAATLRLRDGRVLEGSDLRVNARGDYVITVGSSQRTYPAAQVAEAVADRPAAYDQAAQLAQAGRYDEALTLLGDTAARYARLGWDDQANYLAARIQARQGRFEEAETTFRKLSARFREQPDVKLAAAQVQVETGAYAEAEKALDELIRSATRDLAARAQLLRGDLKRKRRQLQPAAEDYLRTVLLFENVRDLQPEALFKAADTLGELRDDRARELREELLRNYPDSDYAARARAE